MLSSQLESSYKASQKLSNLLWQLPYADRKSILQQQNRVIEAVTEVAEDADFNTRDGIDEEDDESCDSYFDLAETDLNEEELDL